MTQPIPHHPPKQRHNAQKETDAWAWVPEWFPQAGVILAWPNASTDWADNLAAAQNTYLSLIGAICQVEPIWLLVPNIQEEHSFYQLWSRFLSDKAVNNSEHLSTIVLPFNDTWLRDTGPLTLVNTNTHATDRIKLLSFTFNGWGNKFNHALDQTLAQRLVNMPTFCQALPQQAPFEQLSTIAEGGNLETNGTGIVLTQRHCLMHANRPNNLNEAAWHALMTKKLGASKLWLLDHGELQGDDTDGHIDTLVRFTNANTLVYQQCDEPSYPFYATLQRMEQQLESWTNNPQYHVNNQPLKIIPLPWPTAVYGKSGERLAATYANFLILNKRILLPSYDVPEDRLAKDQISALFPNHEIILINARSLIEQGGSIHCATMQVHTPVT